MTKRLIYMGDSLRTLGSQRNDDGDLCSGMLHRAGNHLLHGFCPLPLVTKSTQQIIPNVIYHRRNIAELYGKQLPTFWEERSASVFRA